MSTLNCKEYLREAYCVLSDHCLYQSAIWINELLCSINDTQSYGTFESILPNTIDKYEYEDKYSLAKFYFQKGEFSHASHILLTIPDKKWRSNDLFLWAYSVYMDGERIIHENCLRHKDTLKSDENNQQNSFLDVIEQRIITYPDVKHDPFLLYLLGVIYSKTQRNNEAIDLYIASINIYPCLWCSWLNLATLMTTIKDLNIYINLITTSFLIKDLFNIYVLNLLQNNDVVFSICKSLQLQLKNNIFHLTQYAIAYYNNKDFDEACSLFQTIIDIDPFNIHCLDIYSNILYIQDNKKELSLLAHRVEQIDKFCPETCIIFGNYYSLNGQHEDALLYFQRAVKLNPMYSEAWTLIGHEYVELKRQKEAIVAYKTALDYNNHDYRAWYGLGLLHELLHVYTFAVYYYKQALYSRPNDSRILCGLASCYFHLNNMKDCIACYIQADTYKDIQGVASYKLGEIYESKNEIEKSVYYYQKYIMKIGRDIHKSTDEVVKSLLFVIRYYKGKNDIKNAFEYGDILLSTCNDQKIIDTVHQILNTNNFDDKKEEKNK